MNKIEAIEITPNLSEIIKSVEVNGTIEINANRVMSFKATVNRINKKIGLRSDRYLFTYSEIKNDYCLAKRTA